MEALIGNLEMKKGKLMVNNQEIEYEEFNDPNRPHNFKTVVLHNHGKDDIITEFDTETELLQQVAEKFVK